MRQRSQTLQAAATVLEHAPANVQRKTKRNYQPRDNHCSMTHRFMISNSPHSVAEDPASTGFEKHVSTEKQNEFTFLEWTLPMRMRRHTWPSDTFFFNFLGRGRPSSKFALPSPDSVSGWPAYRECSWETVRLVATSTRLIASHPSELSEWVCGCVWDFFLWNFKSDQEV